MYYQPELFYCSKSLDLSITDIKDLEAKLMYTAKPTPKRQEE